jgi:hypothetical protein
MVSDIMMAKKLEQDLVVDGLVFEAVQNCKFYKLTKSNS